ncbi:MAG: murein transglycosylase domain-containing protein, partial [SAR202 cluster bacterium]|nr:murein transglycosylase domain-containing protein [SAR202 cluster bacterium]
MTNTIIFFIRKLLILNKQIFAVFIFISVSIVIAQEESGKYSPDDFANYQKQQMEAFQNYKQTITAQYEAYEQQEKEAYEKFKEEIEQKWDAFKEPESKVYIEYSEDSNTRQSVDFENGKITIEIIVEEIELDDEPKTNSPDKIEPDDEPKINSPDNSNVKSNPSNKNSQSKNDSDSINKPKKQISNKIDSDKKETTSNQNTQKQASPQQKEITKSEDDSEKKIKEKLTEALIGIITKKADDNKPLLENQVENSGGQNITVNNVENEAEDVIEKKEVKAETYKSKDGKKRTKYTVTIPLKNNHLDERIKRYEKDILKQAERWKLDPTIVFALMETESAFNPKARSHIPAFGLLQLVPKSGARDAYRYVYKEDKLVTGDYLYEPINNIELGCAYLAKIRYYYFENIKDDELAYICSIPAYNTGIGNVSKTLCGKPHTNPAAKVASSMNAQELYNKLTTELKYEEARN